MGRWQVPMGFDSPTLQSVGRAVVLRVAPEKAGSIPVRSTNFNHQAAPHGGRTRLRYA